MSRRVRLNDGAQHDFVVEGARGCAYIGGLGSGKTYAGLAKGLALSQQPLVGSVGPRGVIARESYPALRANLLEPFYEFVTELDLWKTGKRSTSYNKSEWTARLKANCGCPNRTTCPHEAQVLLVSLDDPDWIRGVELSWFFIDEGRNADLSAWKVLWGRLRQKGYKHQGFVCSTPNGFDWMYHKFHEKGRDRVRGGKWYTAATMDNRKHLPPEYIPELLAEYKGRLARQEVYGEFVGAVDGAVFFEWDQTRHARPLPSRDDLPLYTAWDFGMGALGVVEWVQLEWVEEQPEDDGPVILVPKLYVLDGLESPNRTSKEWAKVVREHSAATFGRQAELNICDPAGRQRNVSTGTSVVDDLNAAGMLMTPAPKKPIDYGIRILNNLMAANRFVVAEEAERVWSAFASHKWNISPDGQRIGPAPVHDWTSHYVDPVRYVAATLLPHAARKKPGLVPDAPQPGTMGHIIQQLLHPQEVDPLRGPSEPHVEWYPGNIIPA